MDMVVKVGGPLDPGSIGIKVSRIPDTDGIVEVIMSYLVICNTHAMYI